MSLKPPSSYDFVPLPDRNPLLMQIFADATNREYRVIRSALGGAVGAALPA